MRVSAFGEKVTRVAFGVKVEPPQERRTVKIDSKVLKTYAGMYQIVPQFKLTVTVEDGKLMVQATGQSKFQVFPESETEFFYKVVDAQLTFVKDPKGKVTHLILHQGGIDQKAVRQD